MPYRLGIDLGTTFTAAATFRDSQVNAVWLGNRCSRCTVESSLRRRRPC